MCIFGAFNLMSLSKVIHYSGTSHKWHICCLMFLFSSLAFAQETPIDEAVEDSIVQDSVVVKEPVLLDKIKRHADGYTILNLSLIHISEPTRRP